MFFGKSGDYVELFFFCVEVGLYFDVCWYIIFVDEFCEVFFVEVIVVIGFEEVIFCYGVVGIEEEVCSSVCEDVWDVYCVVYDVCFFVQYVFGR